MPPRYPDAHERALGVAFSRSRAQARFRKEPWTLTKEEYRAVWQDRVLFPRRGRKPQELVMTRCDSKGSWTVGNVEIVTRLEQLLRQENRGRRLPRV